MPRLACFVQAARHLLDGFRKTRQRCRSRFHKSGNTYLHKCTPHTHSRSTKTLERLLMKLPNSLLFSPGSSGGMEMVTISHREDQRSNLFQAKWESFHVGAVGVFLWSFSLFLTLVNKCAHVFIAISQSQVASHMCLNIFMTYFGINIYFYMLWE